MRFDYKENITETTEVVTLEMAKNHLRVNYTDEDTQIQRMIKTSRRWCEQYTQRSLIERTMTVLFYNLDRQTEFTVPYEPVEAITQVARVKGDGTEQVLVEGKNYRVLGLNAKIIQTNQFYDSGAFGMDSQMKITYTLGVETTGREEYQDAILKLVADMYRNRENNETENIGGSANGTAYFAAKEILDPLRVKLWL